MHAYAVTRISHRTYAYIQTYVHAQREKKEEPGPRDPARFSRFFRAQLTAMAVLAGQPSRRLFATRRGTTHRVAMDRPGVAESPSEVSRERAKTLATCAAEFRGGFDQNRTRYVFSTELSLRHNYIYKKHRQ